MGRKVHPMGFRTGIIRDWQARWYAGKSYVDFLQEDLKLRRAIQSGYSEAGISAVEIDRQANEVSVTVHTARPGVVIGRGGQRVDEMRLYLENLIGKKIRLNIQEIRQPELDAYLVAKAIAEQMERRISYRRAMKQAIFRTMQAGAKGIRISCAGRLGGAEIARRQTMHQGQVPLHTLRADVDYGFTEACTTLGRIGVKTWIYKGDILPESKVAEIEKKPPEVAEVEGKPPEVAEVEGKPPEVAEVEEKPPEVAEVEEKPPEVAEVEEKPPEVAEVEEKPPEVAEVKKKPTKVAEAKKKPTKVAEAKKKPPEVAEAKKKPPEVAEAKKKPPEVAEAKKKPTKVAEAKKKPPKVAEAKKKPPEVAEAKKKPTKVAGPKKKPTKVLDSSLEGEAGASAEMEGSDATT